MTAPTQSKPITLTETLRAAIAAEVEAGRSQRQIAHSVGCDHSTLSRWLRGDCEAGGALIDAVYAYLGRRAAREAALERAIAGRLERHKAAASRPKVETLEEAGMRLARRRLDRG